MTARLYQPFAEDMLEMVNNTAPTPVNTKSIVLLGAGYTFSAAHQFADATGFQAAIIASQNIAGVTIANGVLGATSPVNFPTVASGSTVTQWALIEDTGTPATSRLIFYSNESTNLPLATNDQDINLDISNQILELVGTP